MRSPSFNALGCLEQILWKGSGKPVLIWLNDCKPSGYLWQRYDQNFYQGWAGVMDGERGSSEKCLKWGSRGLLRDLSKHILKQGVGKSKSCSLGGEGSEGVTTPVPPETFNRTPRVSYLI